jgi:hypothetical protein
MLLEEESSTRCISRSPSMNLPFTFSHLIDENLRGAGNFARSTSLWQASTATKYGGDSRHCCLEINGSGH